MSSAILVTGASRGIGEAVHTGQTIVADGGYCLVDHVMKWEPLTTRPDRVRTLATRTGNLNEMRPCAREIIYPAPQWTGGC